jgi:hypothetical protein
MNRDERRDRPEVGYLCHPQNYESSIYCYPSDRATGGTWIGANGRGTIAALLNDYSRKNASVGAQSRGLIVPTILNEVPEMELDRYLARNNWSFFSPFNLVVVNATEIKKLSWDGSTTHLEKIPIDRPYFITSSSRNAAAVIPFREKLFCNFRESRSSVDVTAPDIFRNLHLVQSEDKSSSILMNRKVTHTKSVCQILRNSESVRVSYFSEAALSNSPIGNAEILCLEIGTAFGMLPTS